MKMREEISKAVVKRYKKPSKKEKGKILDEFTKITGYNRIYASWLLNNLGKKIVFYRDGKRIILVGEKIKKKKRERPVIYETVVKNFVSGLPFFFQILN